MRSSAFAFRARSLIADHGVLLVFLYPLSTRTFKLVYPVTNGCSRIFLELALVSLEPIEDETVLSGNAKLHLRRYAGTWLSLLRVPIL